MKKSAIVLICVLLASQLLAGCFSKEKEEEKEQVRETELAKTGPDLKKATDLVTRKKWDQAIELLSVITTEYPESGDAWYLLGYAHHSKKDYSSAIDANQKATQYSSKFRSSAYYNIACAYSLIEEIDKAESALNSELDDGFLDFDLLKTDPELSLLRKAGLIELPKSQSYKEIKALNGIRIKYHVILPNNYDQKKAYPAMLAYPPGSQGQNSADWSISKFWGDAAKDKNWIIVVPVAPSNGWINHPSHHALNDLLKEVKGNHKIEGGKFHMVGFESGARPAATFALMSKQYFQSLTTVSSHAWERWDDDDFDSFTIMPVKMIVGEQDTHGVQVANRVKHLFQKNKVRSELEIIPNEGRNLPSLINGKLIDLMAEFVR